MSEPRVELMPLIDVVFLLLAFFVFALVLSARLEVTDVELPGASAGDAPGPGEYIVLQLDAQGRLQLSGEPLAWESIGNAVENERARRPEATLLVAPDVGSSSGDLFRLVDALTEAGVRNLRFLRQPSQGAPAPPADGAATEPGPGGS